MSNTSDRLAYIQFTCHQTELLPGRIERSFTAQWIGSRHWPIKITTEALGALLDKGFQREDSTISILPWQLKLIDYDYLRGESLYARVDGPYCLTWAAYWLRSRLKAVSRYLTIRAVLTLMVWGLAYCPASEVISWKCVGRKQR